MAKKYDVKSKGSDLFGNKRYEVTEKKSTADYGYIFLAIFALIIFTLPSGIIALILFVILKNLKFNPDKIFLPIIIVSVILTIIYFVKFYNLDENGLSIPFIASIMGAICYYFMYKIGTKGLWKHIVQ